ncbi:hypothetical protein RJ639_025026 [Escallonia herrerae]|uniref:Glutamine amidotransferase domain-containing protein n=1 Tax=Escallonia herrerae TaxID=1293975 RepID=A0AA88USI5_9ASTE|nr:hypothetical protein RJ639_025026 [Escallonia herrerae]
MEKSVIEFLKVFDKSSVVRGGDDMLKWKGGKVVRSPHGVMHGKSSFVYYNEGGEDGLFTGLSNPFTAGRYHSLVIEKDSFPSEVLEITAWTEDGLVMAARHKIHRHLLLARNGKGMVEFMPLMKGSTSAAESALIG